MTIPELALVCSSSPGFIRGVGSALGRHYRIMECYTIPESLQMIQLHRPQMAVIDLRGSPPRQTARAWAMMESARSVRFVVVTNPGQLTDHEIPLELDGQVEIAELAGHEDALARLAADLIAGGPVADRRTPVSEEEIVATEQISPTASAVRESAATKLVGTPQNKVDADTAQECPAADTRPAASVSAATEASSMVERYRTRTPELRQMLRRLEVAARHNVTILLIGETGSGKTHLASLIHDVSPRMDEPFLHVACGALPGELIESELFGHVKGAFTSAHADKDGKFLVAGNGTILLDEIDVLTPDQQVKLLRVIERGEFEPVGSNKTLHVRARIIAASNLQLQPLVEQGRFRPDLYYRLNTLCFTIPPLRKRLPDIEPLARYFVHLHAEQLGIDVVEITPEFIDCLLAYPWPGNVREMENSIRSAVIYSENGRMSAETLPIHVIEGTAGPASDPSVAAFFGARQGDSLGNRIELTEKDLIEQALLNNNFSRTNTARHLGISRVTLYNKMRKHGIMPER